MKAKFVNETLQDIFKPKTEQEVQSLFNKAFKKYHQYIVKETPSYAIFQFDIDNEEVLQDFCIMGF